MEQFANNCITYVAAGGYTAASGVLNVDSTAAPFPQVGDFRISIFDKDDDSLKVILKVTAITSGTQFAVTAESADANADEDDVVRGTMLTSTVMKNIGWVLLASKSASNSASLDFTSLISSLYDEYILEFINIIPATNNTTLLLRCSTDNGSNYDSGTNYSVDYIYNFASTAGAHSPGNTGIWLDGSGINNTEVRGGASGTCRMFNPLSASAYKHFKGESVHYDNGQSAYVAFHIFGVYLSATAVNAFKVLMSSGNITSGTVRLYGVAK